MAGLRAALTAVALAGALAWSCGAAGSDAGTPAIPAPPPTDRFPHAAAAYAVAIDDDTVWGRGLDASREPASLTKLLAALVITGKAWDPGARVVVSRAAAAAPSVRLGLRAGDVLSAGDALAAMLLHSANDACAALVESVSADAGDFAQRMNDEARRLGMTASRFVDPCGLDRDGQASTARDLLRLARAAEQREVIARTVSQRSAMVRTAAGRQWRVDNGNALLGTLDGVVGMKTGFTSRAGPCLIALARRDGHAVWLVMLDAKDRWRTGAGIIVDAFDRVRLGGRDPP